MFSRHWCYIESDDEVSVFKAQGETATCFSCNSLLTYSFLSDEERLVLPASRVFVDRFIFLSFFLSHFL